MRAASERTYSVGQQENSAGILFDLTFEPDVNSLLKLAFEHRTIFTRLHHFVLATHAFIVRTGGVSRPLETL